MKKLMLVLSVCLLAGLAAAQVQTVPVILQSAPVGDCRVQFYAIAYVPSTQVMYGCNTTTGAWSATVAAGAGTTGTGSVVLQTSPTLITPVLGVATATSINGNTLTTGTGTLTLATGKVLTASNTLTLAGTDSTTMTFPTTSATIARTDAANTFTGVQTMTSAALTTPVISTITNTGTETLPTTTGGIPVVIACGNTTTGSGTCANTAVGATSKVYFGNATLASNAQTVTISPGFTASSSFQCLANDLTTRANPVQAVPASATTFTITNTTGASDLISWICVGN